MTDRRQILTAGLAATLASGMSGAALAANQAAWAVLSKGGSALDAVEAGARIPEADLKNHSVGRAGYPDRDGHVSLDASIMDRDGNCGAVAGLEHIAHPISVARKVMEKTPHVLLVGDGALQFALQQGFPREELLTPESRAAWDEALGERLARLEKLYLGELMGTADAREGIAAFLDRRPPRWSDT